MKLKHPATKKSRFLTCTCIAWMNSPEYFENHLSDRQIFVFQGTICVRYVQKYNRRKFEGLADNTEWPAKDNVVGNLKIPENGNKRDSTNVKKLNYTNL